MFIGLLLFLTLSLALVSFGFVGRMVVGGLNFGQIVMASFHVVIKVMVFGIHAVPFHGHLGHNQFCRVIAIMHPLLPLWLLLPIKVTLPLLLSLVAKSMVLQGINIGFSPLHFGLTVWG
ncbi:hypothetical protein N7510_006142 [Penicillium lagena]|uniref:uncharacterized protein n=1 Tax=Penicillium lagena TaxID=94218 RepID=UPI002541D73A|nr:uncharacterized protein N7510_006142 [Penicillium lagena]KAJ5612948.1 hypothetical protein N7510_006142 [Penicillium lagena]